MPSIRTDVSPRELQTDRWLIEALSVMSSNARVRAAATAWLAAYSAALSLGCTEQEAQSRADEAFQQGVAETPTPAPRATETCSSRQREAGTDPGGVVARDNWRETGERVQARSGKPGLNRGVA
jgi:hypothetical protein